MKISAPELSGSPRGSEWIRAQVEVSYQGLLPSSEKVWFDLPAELEAEVDMTGDPWLTALLPAAVARAEPVALEAPVSVQKLGSARRLMQIWSDWYPQLKPVDLEAETLPAREAPHGRLTACFFSGGVDSFYTVLHDRETTGGGIDELLFVHGADIPLDNRAAYQRATHTLRRSADGLGLPLQVIGTNLRQTRFDEAHYDFLASSSLLGAVGLLLGPRYERVLISATWAGAALHPAGSHPDTDPLHANDLTQLIHYGDWFNRIPKTEFISLFALARENLRVCWESDRGGNCGRCLKCMRTMTALEILRVLQDTAAFEADALDLERLRSLMITREARYYRHLIPFARQRGREDVAAAIEDALARTNRIHRWLLFGLLPAARERLYLNASARRLLAPVYHALRRLGLWLGRRAGRL